MVKCKKRKEGFTLIEVIIVIAIIAILASIALPKFGEIRQSANSKADLANAKTIANAVSALVSDGKIDMTVDAFELNPSATSGDAYDIKEYLQSIPTPKSGSGNFWIKVTGGDAKIYIGSATGTLIYPN